MMIHKRILILLTTCIPIISIAQNIVQDTTTITKFLNEVNVNALRATKKTPISFTNLTKSEINEKNHGKDIPYILNFTPSIVSNSDAGNGFGYTSFRLRGSDATRINVTINGIPVNDAESQGVWWVNMPDLASSIENIQIQRGVGTSSNGASAFGGTINFQTNKSSKKSYVRSANSVGSFSSYKNNIQFGTGLINNHIALDGRISKISSQGFIDRASSDLTSYMFELGYYAKKQALRALVFGGHEKTYQDWYGVPLRFLNIDSLRTYNPYTYDNETDNYQQTHYQLHYDRQIGLKSHVKISAHYTHGEGFYEQEKLNEPFLNYGIQNITTLFDTIYETDLIRRKWLNNDFGGIVYSFKHNFKKFNLTIGGAINQYEGQHYGNIIWAEYSSNIPHDFEYYWNKAKKIDQNAYCKVIYQRSNQTNMYIDLQKRWLGYKFQGIDDQGDLGIRNVSLSFFNPKVGIYHSLSQSQIFYASFGIANKEPNRNDYVDSEYDKYPVHETLFDWEVSHEIKLKKISLKTTLYRMNYRNQLVATGQINNVGAYIRTNVDNSYRSGLEFEGAVALSKKIDWNGNITISKNKINQFTEYVDNWDTGAQNTIDHSNTDISFSPNLIWNSRIKLQINDNLSLSLITKHVGRQFIDNTSSNDRMLDAYTVNNIYINMDIKSSWLKESEITFNINNIFNKKYENNAWVYRFISNGYDPTSDDLYVNKNKEGGYNMAAYFPQAGTNFLVGLTLGI